VIAVSPLLRMSNQACPGVVRWGALRLRRLRAQQILFCAGTFGALKPGFRSLVFSDDRIDVIRQRTCHAPLIRLRHMALYKCVLID